MPATLAEEKIEKVLSCSDSLVLMRVYKNYDQIVGQLDKCGLSENAVMVSRCGFVDEEITNNLNDGGDKEPNYLSTILARKRSAGSGNND